MEKKRGQGIKHVSHLFDRYLKTLKAPQKTVCGAFIRSVLEVVGVELKTESCTYNPNSKTISFSASGPVRSEVALHKKEILSHMSKELGAQNTPKNIL